MTVLGGIQLPGESQHTFQSVLPEAAGLFLDLERPGPIAQDGFVDAAKAYHRMQNRIRTQNTRLHESSEKKVKIFEQHKSYYKKKVVNETLAQKKKRNERAVARYHKSRQARHLERGRNDLHTNKQLTTNVSPRATRNNRKKENNPALALV